MNGSTNSIPSSKPFWIKKAEDILRSKSRFKRYTATLYLLFAVVEKIKKIISTLFLAIPVLFSSLGKKNQKKRDVIKFELSQQNKELFFLISTIPRILLYGKVRNFRDLFHKYESDFSHADPFIAQNWIEKYMKHEFNLPLENAALIINGYRDQDGNWNKEALFSDVDMDVRRNKNETLFYQNEIVPIDPSEESKNCQNIYAILQQDLIEEKNILEVLCFLSQTVRNIANNNIDSFFQENKASLICTMISDRKGEKDHSSVKIEVQNNKARIEIRQNFGILDISSSLTSILDVIVDKKIVIECDFEKNERSYTTIFSFKK